jgi:polysaccharide biosynthesis protein PslH
MKLLVVSPVPTDPQTAGNRARVLNLFTALESLGHDVTFAYVPYEHGNDDCEAMERRLHHRLCVLQTPGPPFQSQFARLKRKIKWVLGFPSAHLWNVDEWFDDGLLPQMMSLQNAENFDCVVIEYVFLSKLVSVFPKSVRTIIDTHDLFADRHKHYLENGMKPVWFATTAAEEVNALNRADAVIAIQEKEAAYLRSQGIGEVFCVGHILSHESVPLPDPGGMRMLFVGSANPINIQGLKWFVSVILPLIRAAIPGCEFMIAGAAGYSGAWPGGVLTLGEVDSLAAAYAEATIVVNPVIFGTGLAVKTAEALSYGKPVVATPAGARGLGMEFAEAIFVAEDDRSFAQGVIELLRSKAARVKLSHNALSAISRWRQRQLTELEAAINGNKNCNAAVVGIRDNT